jgi:hypothetical protein
MDLTLNEIISKIDTINIKISNIKNSEINQINSYLIKLSKLHTYINDVNIKLCNIYNICNNISISKKSINKINNFPYFGYYNLNSCNESLLNKGKKCISNEVNINIKYIDSIDEIPSVPIYWVKNINQFAIRINDTILRGNVGNIYNSSSIRSNESTNQTIICKNKNTCKNLFNNITCKFYHDPMDLLKLFTDNKISNEQFEKYKTKHRNFINTSWLYTDQPFTNKNKTLRQFGSKFTLKNEIDIMKLDNSKINSDKIDNFKQQTIHDLLICMGLNQYDLL